MHRPREHIHTLSYVLACLAWVKSTMHRPREHIHTVSYVLACGDCRRVEECHNAGRDDIINADQDDIINAGRDDIINACDDEDNDDNDEDAALAQWILSLNFCHGS